jgi:hypothetical protein
MIVKLFTKPNCQKCFPAKNLCTSLEADGFAVKRYDLDSVDGMAEGAMYEVQLTPSVVVVDDKDDEVKSWRGAPPKKEEILEILKK